MKFSYNWLKSLINFDLSAQELSNQLCLLGLEVEGIETIGDSISGIITARIDKLEDHPDADKLLVGQLFDGKNTHQVCAGAKNIRVGDIIPFAPTGSTIANGMTLKKVSLRGVESNGMMCSESELAAADTSDGIWVLDPETPIGIDFVEYASLKDSILDIAILPNRGDTQSYLGVAREIAVMLGKDFKIAEPTFKKSAVKQKISITNHAKKACPLYAARIITDITQKETPLWMKRRLQVSGIRPISILVDITNYVLLEYGQPLHAFDYDTIDHQVIEIRLADEKETFITLDNEKRALKVTDCLICDGKKPVALGGVMGGLNSEVTEKTQTVLLESAYFKPVTIRKTAHHLSLHTDSAVRFEKGVDPEAIIKASNRAAELIQELTGATISDDPILSKEDKEPAFKSTTIDYTDTDINKLLGTAIPAKKQKELLTSLGFEFQTATKIKVPSWRRSDVTEHPCIAEEIARVYGYDNLDTCLPPAAPIKELRSTQEKIESDITNYLISQGFSQINTFTMISPKDLSNLQIDSKDVREIQNPISNEESLMRPILLPSFLKVVQHNMNRQNQNLQLFEFGKTFQANSESLHVGFLVTGNKIESPYLEEDKTHNTDSFITTKHLLEQVLSSIGIHNITITPNKPTAYMHPNISCDINLSKETIGTIGAVHPKVARLYDCEQSIYYVQINCEFLLSVAYPEITYIPYSKFPSTRRDIALVVPKNLSYAEIQETIQKIKPKLVQRFFLFDLFESEKLGKDQKSLAIGFIYQNNEGTLSDDKVNKAHEWFSKTLLEKLPVQIRA